MTSFKFGGNYLFWIELLDETVIIIFIFSDQELKLWIF